MAVITVGTENDHPVELSYSDVGAGRPVVLIHGWPLSSRAWEAQVPVLVDAGYRVVTYDRRGFGASSQPWGGYDYDTLTADLHALVTHLDLHDAALVGFSMGGGEVVRYLSRYGSDRVSAAVLAGAVTPYLYKSDTNPEGGLDDSTIETLEAGVRTDRAAFLDGFLKAFFAAGGRTDLLSEPARAYHLDMALWASPKATLDCIRAWGQTDFRPDLAAVTVPTLVIHGSADGTVPFEVSGKRSHAAIPGSSLVVVDSAPHGFTATHPSEFNAALLDFLATSRSS